jgi:hypothetical protein
VVSSQDLYNAKKTCKKIEQAITKTSAQNYGGYVPMIGLFASDECIFSRVRARSICFHFLFYYHWRPVIAKDRAQFYRDDPERRFNLQLLISSNLMNSKTQSLRVLVVGCGNMGASHATAYHNIDGFEICGIVSTGKSKEVLNQKLGGGFPLFSSYEKALGETTPDAVCISTYPDTHENFAIKALEKGCHVFIEKPVADTVQGA